MMGDWELLCTLVPESSFYGKPDKRIDHGIEELQVTVERIIRVCVGINAARFQSFWSAPGFNSRSTDVGFNQTKSL